MPRRPLTRFAVAAALLGPAVGCGSAPADVPVMDVSGGGYGEVAFKDDAPANATAADFPQSFVDAEGNPVDLAKCRGRKVVLVVLRGIPRTEGGAFCPSCLAQAGSLTANRHEFDRRGAEVLVLFPGPADRVDEFTRAARLRAPGGFRLLLDRDLRACDRLGIRADLAKPSTYVLDTRGRVTYAYVGETSTDRPSVKAVLAQLDRAE
jgi:peroxiredoxin